jgi:hypothetical protein
MHYLTPNNTFILPAYRDAFGLFESMGSRHNAIAINWPLWGLDNGRFNPSGKPGVNPKWSGTDWLESLDYYSPEARAKCKFCVVPDVPYEKAPTLDIYYQYLPDVLGRGYPPALCIQDGMTVADMPWSDMAAVFIGGSDEYKLGGDAAEIAMAAQERGLWVHVGRVNSIKRMRMVWWADSVDGRMLVFNSGIDRQRLLAEGVSYCRAKKRTRRLL